MTPQSLARRYYTHLQRLAKDYGCDDGTGAIPWVDLPLQERLLWEAAAAEMLPKLRSDIVLRLAALALREMRLDDEPHKAPEPNAAKWVKAQGHGWTLLVDDGPVVQLQAIVEEWNAKPVGKWRGRHSGLLGSWAGCMEAIGWWGGQHEVHVPPLAELVTLEPEPDDIGDPPIDWSRKYGGTAAPLLEEPAPEIAWHRVVFGDWELRIDTEPVASVVVGTHGATAACLGPWGKHEQPRRNKDAAVEQVKIWGLLKHNVVVPDCPPEPEAVADDDDGFTSEEVPQEIADSTARSLR